MRKELFVVFCSLLFGSLAMAQDKIENKWNCAKPTEMHSLLVGDVPGHSYAIAQGSCTATDSSLGEKTATYTEFQELHKTSFTNHGHFTTTMDNGDMAHYSYAGSGPADIKKPVSNKWQILSATGKHKGIKGSGTCSGTRHDDGSSDWVCTGTSSMAK